MTTSEPKLPTPLDTKEFQIQLMNVLGLNPETVLELSIHIKAGHPTTVNVLTILEVDEQGGLLKAAAQGFYLMPATLLVPVGVTK